MTTDGDAIIIRCSGHLTRHLLLLLQSQASPQMPLNLGIKFKRYGHQNAKHIRFRTENPSPEKVIFILFRIHTLSLR